MDPLVVVVGGVLLALLLILSLRPLPGLRGRSGERVPLVTLTADPSTMMVDVDPAVSERRAQRALDKFKPEEQQVLLAWEPGMTWQEAADAAGLTPEVAERVRRKRKRVAQEEAKRTAALSVTMARAG